RARGARRGYIRGTRGARRGGDAGEHRDHCDHRSGTRKAGISTDRSFHHRAMGDDDITASPERWRMIGRATATLLAAAAFYETVAQSGIFPGVMGPALPKVVHTLFNLLGAGTMLRPVFYTLLRVI